MENCTLCPRLCHARRDDKSGTGFCGMGALPLIARAAPHFWEEPCISGTRGAGAIFFSGCTLKCVYCQNGDISHQPRGRYYTPAQLADLMRQLVDEDVHVLDFVTPTHYTNAILEALALYHPPVPIVWNTSGYESVETLKRLEGVVSVYLPDLKHYSAHAGQLCAHAPDYFEVASRAIAEMVRQTGLPQYNDEGIMTRGTLIRHLILPGLTTESLRLLAWVKDTLPQGVPVSLMRQYVPLNHVAIPGLQRRITQREYDRVEAQMNALDIPGYCQGPEAADAAFVPDWDQAETPADL